MVRITKVHTGAGDGGKTRLLDGTEVGKEDPRVRLYGTIDEGNSQLGVGRMELNRMPGVPVEARNSADEAMGRVQQELFDIGGECSCTPGKLPEQMVLIGSDAGDRLVAEMDSWLEELEPLESFIMPTGSWRPFMSPEPWHAEPRGMRARCARRMVMMLCEARSYPI